MSAINGDRRRHYDDRDWAIHHPIEHLGESRSEPIERHGRIAHGFDKGARGDPGAYPSTYKLMQNACSSDIWI
ncbi:MAG TPA: hypothetical protein VFR48_11620 [Solirubrobacteraceae bacterium]|nr:hypothetical protein [Solirubrobacteraceae bacterium]